MGISIFKCVYLKTDQNWTKCCKIFILHWIFLKFGGYAFNMNRFQICNFDKCALSRTYANWIMKFNDILLHKLSSILLLSRLSHWFISLEQGRWSMFRIGGAKVKKCPKFSASSARQIVIQNFAREARRKIDNFVCLIVFLGHI